MFPDYLDAMGALPYFTAALIGGYLIGGLPFGLWIARAFGLDDPRAAGSGNIGAANMARTGGWKLGLLTLLLDAAKGALPAWIGFEQLGANGMIYAGLGAFIGHCFSPYLGLRGGKGIATAFGVFAVWDPINALICAGIWVATAALSRRASAASLATALAAIAVFFFRNHWGALWAVPLMAVIAIWLHRENIRRLISGVEPKIGERA